MTPGADPGNAAPFPCQNELKRKLLSTKYVPPGVNRSPSGKEIKNFIRGQYFSELYHILLFKTSRSLLHNEFLPLVEDSNKMKIKNFILKITKIVIEIFEVTKIFYIIKNVVYPLKVSSIMEVFTS